MCALRLSIYTRRVGSFLGAAGYDKTVGIGVFGRIMCAIIELSLASQLRSIAKEVL